LKNLHYQSIHEFALDLRKLWSYNFANYTHNSDIFQKTCKLSEYSEEVIKEVENVTEEKSDLNEIHKKLAKLEGEVKNIQVGKPVTTQNIVKKNDKRDNLDRPMSIQEKNSLGNSIRNLNPDQLKGIVNILTDSLVIDGSNKFFEFDIETLSTRKLRELEKYVKSCIKTKGHTKQADPKQSKKPVPQQEGHKLTENQIVERLRSELLPTQQSTNSTNYGSFNQTSAQTPQVNNKIEGKKPNQHQQKKCYNS